MCKHKCIVKLKQINHVINKNVYHTVDHCYLIFLIREKIQ